MVQLAYLYVRACLGHSVHWSRLAAVGEGSNEGEVSVKTNPMIRDQDKAYDNDDDKNELI